MRVTSHMRDEKAAKNILAWVFLVVLGIMLAVGALMLKHRDKAYDKANLECRLSGGTYEYFGWQGYHCIGAPSQAQGTD